MSDIEIPKVRELTPGPSTSTAAGLVSAHTGLRGLLALWIVIFHVVFFSAGWNLHGSALMPLFFLLSGYSLAIGYGRVGSSRRIEADEQKPQVPRAKFDLSRYFKNRFARIAPVYYVCMLLALPLCIFGHGWVSPGEIGRVVATNLFAVQMWLPHPAIFAKSFDGPGWTISTLAFFYCIFPWMLKRYQGRPDRALNRSITVLMVVQAIVIFALYFIVSYKYGSTAGFWVAHAWPVSRIPVFEMGVVAGLLVLRQGSPEHDATVKVMGVANDGGQHWARTIDISMLIFATFIIVLSVFHAVTRIELGGSFWMQGVFPFTLLQIIVGLSMIDSRQVSFTARFLNWSPILFLGKISMSLYLVHEPIIQYVAWIVHPDKSWNQALPTPMPIWGIVIVIPISLVLAALLERYVESPARRYLRGLRYRM